MELEYLADIDDVGKFDSKFIEAFSYKLAAELAMPIRQSTELLSAMMNAYTALVSTAASESDGEEHKAISDNPYVEARYGGY